MSISVADGLIPAEMPSDSLSHGLRPLDRAYVHVIRIMTALVLLPVLIAAVVVEFALVAKGVIEHGPVIAPALALAAFILVFLPQRRWRRWGFSDSDEQLRVARGWMFRTDTIVPFKRIQHIDMGQGPIERLFDLASLTVHTAGTHNSIVTLPGLRRSQAEAMRDAMRLHIRREAE
ncbi:PH domain-containing protein [Blastomonas sp. SL216]|uniref:PH domain-containing protein n=1 Tax=Blastomonas sp. SL216 TaxID=2995169 RepID=UPI002376F481|nr:PH domain-containing protein [Blastomonas sp. SL216]